MWTSLWNLDLYPLPWAGAILATMAAALIDIRTRRIPNVLTGPFLLTGLVLALAGAPGFDGIRASLLGAAIAGAPFIALWLIGGGGAGDAKMMLGVGAWLGSQAAVPALGSVAIVGGVLVIVVVLVKGKLGQTLLNIPQLALAMPLVLRSGGVQQRREMLETFTSSGRTPAEQTSDRDGATKPALRIAYGPAIFIGTCVAALWVGWVS
jgi:prepilin peptidase CpaA